MRLLLTIALLGSVLISSACATSAAGPADPTIDQTDKTEKTKKTKTAPKPQPVLVDALPKTFKSFEYTGYKPFEDGSEGYSVRYSNVRKRRIADLYVYPVAEENVDLDHNQLVLGSTRATLLAIGEATRQGHYDNFNVVNAATRAQGVRTVARVQATYLRENLASYTLVYQTEHKGTLLKIRVTMPDNETNRASEEWDALADILFLDAIKALDASKNAGDSTDENRKDDKVNTASNHQAI